MATIKDVANSYEAPKTLNIADLDVVQTDLQIEKKEFVDSEGKPFSMQVITLHGKDYRVPTSVIKSLKEILSEKPNLKFFKVKKTGDGLKTTYTVIPIE